MNKILTLIVPTYNMDDYLHCCLNSLIVSQKQMGELEILIINDGSKDRSSTIAHEYQSKYPDTFRVIDKENGNYGSCVNCGLKEATGKYVKILDADDSFNNEFFKEFIDLLSLCNTDLVITDYDVIDADGAVTCKHTYPFKQNQVLNIDSICTSNAFKKISMHAITYKLDNIRAINYKQTEFISYTDQEWIFLPMVFVKTVEYFHLDLYKYLVGRIGQTMDKKVINKSISHYLKIMNNRLYILQTHKLHPSEAISKYLYYKTTILATFIYRAVLLRKIASLDELEKLDARIAYIDPVLYQKLDVEKIKCIIGFRYIHYFRKHHNYAPSAIVLIYKELYALIK